jgi:glycosyltransferase involved in cell wall biosynthesis
MSAEGTRLKHLSQHLSEMWSVLALIPADVDRGEAGWIDRVYTYDQWSHPFLTDLNPSFVTTISRILQRENVDIVHTSKGVCAAKTLTKILRADTDVVYSAQNVEAAHAREFVDETLPFPKRVLGPRLIPAIERLTVACADFLITVSERDRRAFMDRYDVDADRITAIPTGTTTIDETDRPSQAAVRNRYDLTGGTIAVFHGSYAHPPNQDAVELIQESIAPAVSERGLDIEFLLVGKGMPATDVPNVRSVGFVEDLFAVLRSADFAVVPIRHGGGTKTKVYDYLSVGLPIVATEKAVEGIGIESGRHGLITQSVDEEFLSALVELVGDGALQAELRSNLLELADEWDWGRSAKRLCAFYRAMRTDTP